MKKYKRITDNKSRWQGDCDTDKKVIRVNKVKSKKKSSVISTIVHENYHARYPKATERTTYKKEKEIVKKLSRKQKAKLYSQFK